MSFESIAWGSFYSFGLPIADSHGGQQRVDRKVLATIHSSARRGLTKLLRQMRILLDENFPADFATLLAEHDASNVHSRGWAGEVVTARPDAYNLQRSRWNQARSLLWSGNGSSHDGVFLSDDVVNVCRARSVTLNDHRCVEPFSRKSWPVALSRIFARGYFARPQDLWMLILGGRTDARIAQLRSDFGDHKAFETIYSESDDPWESVSLRFSYQRRKYDTVMSLLPTDRRFGRALDLGCGLGTLSCLLAARADSVLGLDVAQTAVDHARKRHAARSNLTFECGDIVDLPNRLNGQFDIVMIADTLYYLPSTSEVSLDAIADKIADLLVPGGICVLTNHLFALGWDEATRLSRRIHRAFCRSPRFRLISKHWRPFFLTTLLAVSTKPLLA